MASATHVQDAPPLAVSAVVSAALPGPLPAGGLGCSSSLRWHSHRPLPCKVAASGGHFPAEPAVSGGLDASSPTAGVAACPAPAHGYAAPVGQAPVPAGGAPTSLPHT
eukprot:310294-Pleurochrysis_carterae.AAC.1